MRYAEGKLARWLLRLQKFDFDVVYPLGIVNRTADALSCLDSFSTEQIELGDDI